MAEFIGIPGVQAVLNRQPVATNATISCPCGNVLHENATGVYTLRGRSCRNRCYARYNIEAKANVALPTGATVVPIAVGISQNGEIRRSSRAISTPAAVLEYNEVTAQATITVPTGCCFTVAFEPVPASDDPTITPAPVVNLQDVSVKITQTV